MGLPRRRRNVFISFQYLTHLLYLPYPRNKKKKIQKISIPQRGELSFIYLKSCDSSLIMEETASEKEKTKVAQKYKAIPLKSIIQVLLTEEKSVYLHMNHIYELVVYL